MVRMIRKLVAGAALTLLACSPTLNWREVRLGDTPFATLLPCKPDRTIREVPMAGGTVLLQVTGCDAAGATMAVMVAPLPEQVSAVAAQGHWQRASLLNLGVTEVVTVPLTTPSIADIRQAPPTSIGVEGRYPDGRKVNGRLLWLAAAATDRRYLIHLIVYSEPGRRDAEEILATMVEGLRIP
jgi:hypothetical protein